jgi:cob(I)alamin adenosyltransferase
MKLYTGVGDRGETALFDGTRVSKAEVRLAAYGEVDELNATLGCALAAGLDTDLAEIATHLQRDLFAVGARLADPRTRIAERVTKVELGDDDVKRLEDWIDRLDVALPPLRRFILPGGHASGAALHLARVVCRRAERHIVALGVDAVPPELLRYVNRLSDLLFVLARTANHRRQAIEPEW